MFDGSEATKRFLCSILKNKEDVVVFVFFSKTEIFISPELLVLEQIWTPRWKAHEILMKHITVQGHDLTYVNYRMIQTLKTKEILKSGKISVCSLRNQFTGEINPIWNIKKNGPGISNSKIILFLSLGLLFFQKTHFRPKVARSASRNFRSFPYFF